MAAIVFLLIYLICGCTMVRFLLPRKALLVRVWLGLCVGVLLMMWLPALMAFFVRFSVTGHLLSLIPLLALCGGAYLIRDKRPAERFSDTDKQMLKPLLFIALPLCVLSCYLVSTHVLFPKADGLHVGQSTYGDLNLHLSIITSLRDAAFPADYAIFPGERLSYPFLTDSLSTSFMLFGFSLRAAVLAPSFLLLGLVFMGYVMLCVRVADTKGGAALAVLLLFLNGGFGFIYMLDMQNVALGTYAQNELQVSSSLLGRIKDVLEGYYMTPTNHAEFTTYNLRWSNVIADMLVPQRTTMGGWCMVIPCLYLLYDFAFEQVCAFKKRMAHKVNRRQILLLGVLAGALPMVHTHSFTALALISLGFMAFVLVAAPRGERLAAFKPWLMYGVLAAVLSVPQLLVWTFSQISGSAGSFIRIQFNWVNNLGGNGLQDGYFWFYLKNIGLPFLLLILALFEKDTKRRFLASGAFLVFLVAEFILFQPNEYDNNKLFYVWYMLCAIIAADYAVAMFARMKGLRSRYVIAALSVFVFFFSASLTLARECVSDYCLFSNDEVEAAAFIEENTDRDDVFITYTQHINPVSSLAGRTIISGPSMWLWAHGFDISERVAEIRRFYADPTGNMDVIEKYSVDYVFISSYEASNLTINYNALNRDFEQVFESTDGEVLIYRVRQGGEG